MAEKYTLLKVNEILVLPFIWMWHFYNSGAIQQQMTSLINKHFEEHLQPVVQQEGVGARVAVVFCTTDIFRFLTSFFNTLIKGDSWYMTAVLYW